ncbi:chemotaxis protein CheD [Salimicrobium halophilum]|uniref:Probable chemoreceptor glutamine deamidase CheD n=2 Tax=Salimicrobium halophilum TaxID=86666 RepID=A0A1G8Q9N7_9BACI|nr:chemotaxis protein CheD [Salimicrobium halophilum]SDJ01411.1 chemotaxis protein CheD [Salimicrobium halophilum]
MSIIKVSISDAKVANHPHRLRTTGLGSCVGIVLYDNQRKMAGMAHIMLPESTMARRGDLNLHKYADTAIEYVYEELITKGMKKQAMKAMIAGGAQMFQSKSANEMMRIGPRNVEAVKKELSSRGIPLVAEDTGGTNGRTIEFDIGSSELSVKTVAKGAKTLR